MGLFRRKDSEGGAEESGADAMAGRVTWTAPGDPDALPGPLADLAFLTLDHALDSISAGGPLIPLVLAESPAGRNGHRFLAESLEVGLEQAKQFVADDTAWDRAVLAYDGYLTTGDGRHDAIYVMAWDRGSATACAMAHRYVPGDEGRPLERMGNPVYLGSAPPPGG